MEVQLDRSWSSYLMIRCPTMLTTLTYPLRRITTRRSPENHEFDIESCRNYQHYSKPIVILDLLWNLAFVVVSLVVLVSAIGEKPSTPLRVWVFGYALQCLFHVGFVCFEFRGRNDDPDDCCCLADLSPSKCCRSIVKRPESINTMISSIWWVVGFYWIVVGDQALLQDAPRLYWLTVVFLAFDVLFIIFCVGTVCVIMFAIFCCIPIVAIAYAVAKRQGASEADIRSLPKFRYRHACQYRKLDNDETHEAFRLRSELGNASSPDELALHPDDSECCICLSRYVDGADLYTLPCNHHFHCGCISKWLRINAICPLCKLNLFRGDTMV